MGLGSKVHREQLDSGLPADLHAEFDRLAEWAGSLHDKFGGRIALRVIDVASIEGFFKSLVRRVHAYPAFSVDGARYVGTDFRCVDSLIADRLAARRV